MKSIPQNFPDHGGDIAWASEHFRIPQNHWIDLSTGISPWAWPIPKIPTEIWQRLPRQNKELLKTAANYYQCEIENIRAVPGSQYAIENIAKELKGGNIAVPSLAYTEHRKTWETTSSKIYTYDSFEKLASLTKKIPFNIIVVVNPNNPTCELWHPEQLKELSVHVKTNNGFLIVDEAFIDLNPEYSIINLQELENIIVLRSVGKFFGLAGLRLGFVISTPSVIKNFKFTQHLWNISSPAEWLGQQFLSDKSWICEQKKRINRESAQLAQTLSQHLQKKPDGNAGLFLTYFFEIEKGIQVFNKFANKGVLIRLGTTGKNSVFLRYGLPGEQTGKLLEKLDFEQKDKP